MCVVMGKTRDADKYGILGCGILIDIAGEESETNKTSYVKHLIKNYIITRLLE